MFFTFPAFWVATQDPQARGRHQARPRAHERDTGQCDLGHRVLGEKSIAFVVESTPALGFSLVMKKMLPLDTLNSLQESRTGQPHSRPFSYHSNEP